MGSFLELVLNQVWVRTVRGRYDGGAPTTRSTMRKAISRTRIRRRVTVKVGLSGHARRRETSKCVGVARQLLSGQTSISRPASYPRAKKHDALHGDCSQDAYHALPKRIIMIICRFYDRDAKASGP